MDIVADIALCLGVVQIFIKLTVLVDVMGVGNRGILTDQSIFLGFGVNLLAIHFLGDIKFLQFAGLIHVLLLTIERKFLCLDFFLINFIDFIKE